MELFHVIEDAVAVTRRKGGKFGQEKLYRRGKDLFVGIGKTYYRVEKQNDALAWGTTDPNLTVLEFDLAKTKHKIVKGRIELEA